MKFLINGEFKINKILIIGGSGYLGSRIAYYLADFFKIVITYNKNINFLKKTFENKKIKSVKLDITNYSQCIKKIKKFDYIIHLASLDENESKKNEKKSLLINTLGTYNIVSACKKNKIKNLIYFSTLHIYGNFNNILNITENLLPNPQNSYAQTHYFAEKYITAANEKKEINGIIFRLSNGYGYPLSKKINRWTLIFNDCCKQAMLKNKIHLNSNGKPIRNFISIEEICFFLKSLILNKYFNQKFYKNNSIVYNLASSNNLSIFKMSKMISQSFDKIFNKKISIKINKNDNSEELFPHINIAKIKKLGFKELNSFDYEVKKTFELFLN